MIDLLTIRLFISFIDKIPVNSDTNEPLTEQLKIIEKFTRGLKDYRAETDIVLIDLIGLMHNPLKWIPIPGDQTYCVDQIEDSKCDDIRYRDLFNLIKSEENHQYILSDYRPIVKFVIDNYDFDDRPALYFLRDLIRSRNFEYIAAGGDNPFNFSNPK